MSTSFIGRKEELNELSRLHHGNVASLVILQGRRRIGKSRLIEEFAKGKKFYSFTGIAPTEKTTAQMQRDEFIRQMAEQFDIPKFTMDDWGDIFTLLAKYTTKGKVIILLDEISWMGSLDPLFLGKLKNTWDSRFKKNPHLMLVLCGSVSSWIEKNIVNSTLFLGRPSLYIKLNGLSLQECNEFWGNFKDKTSPYDKLKVLSVTGGVPRYLELIDPAKAAEDNIKSLCFYPNSPLLDEFDQIFADVFGRRSQIYKGIISRLVLGAATLEELFEACNRKKTGDFSEYLKDLETAGFIARDYTWNIKEEKPSAFSHYRLKDNYVRFYLKYLEKNKHKVRDGLFRKISLSTMSGWSAMLGLQFENLVLNNKLKIIDALGIPYEEVIFVNPFFQKKSKLSPGCQVDLLIHTKFKSLYICEIKFQKEEISLSIIEELKQKISNIKLPKNYSYRPVLIHVNGVKGSVIEAGYFSKVVDFGELLE